MKEHELPDHEESCEYCNDEPLYKEGLCRACWDKEQEIDVSS